MALGYDGLTPPGMPSPGSGGFSLSSDALQGYAADLDVDLGSARNGGVVQRPEIPEFFLQPIYLGMDTSTTTDTPRGFGAVPETTKFKKTKTVKKLTDEFLASSRKEQKEMAFLLVLAGFGPSVDLDDVRKTVRQMNLGEVVDAYHSLLESVNGRNAQGHKITPTMALREAILYRLPPSVNWDGDFDTLGEAISGTKLAPGPLDVGPDGKVAEEEPFTGTKTFTETDRNVIRDIMDPRDAKAITRALLQQELGRDPTEEEFEDFVNTLQAAQRENPTVQTTKTTQKLTFEEGEMVDRDTSSSQRVKRGITSTGLADMALERARSQPGWAEWQAMGTYAPALFAALGSTVEGV